MRIGFVHFDGPLGQSIRTRALIKELRKSTDYCEVVSLNMSDQSESSSGIVRAARSARQFVRPQVGSVEVLKSLILDEALKKRVTRWIHQADPDVVIAETIPAGYLCVDNKNRPPIVLDVHGLTYEQKVRQGRLGRAPTAYWKRVQSISLTKADQLIAVSERMKQYLFHEHGLQNVAIVPNGGYPQPFRAVYAQPLRFLFAGILEYWESPVTLVELSKRLPPKSCTVIGAGSLLRKTLASGPNLEFAGVMSHEEALTASANYQVGLLPSSADVTRAVASPIKLFDYLSVGLPVIAAEAGGWADPVSRFDVGWVTSRDRFCDVTESVSSIDEVTWTKKSENGYQLIQNQFNWHKIVRECLIPVLSRLV